jgi:2-amino-4-hydroxy-6-hydroxymethyldihydropteridine diphosphokinase
LNGRCAEDKEQGIVRLDIDILVYDHEILKPADLERDYVQEGLKALK